MATETTIGIDEDRRRARAEHQALLRRIIAVYDSPIIRAYCTIRFLIINIDILQIIGLGMRDKRRVLEIGCGFGLFGLYFASRNPALLYHGFDIDAGRIAMAREAAKRLGLSNLRFEVGDACTDLPLDASYDCVVMMDLLHHLPDTGKARLLQATVPRLEPGGRLVIKEIARRPAYKRWFTWLLDVAMTQSFDMWYRPAETYRALVAPELTMETYPIADWLPYPHVVYLFTRPEGAQAPAA